jgi:hypothetical protein
MTSQNSVVIPGIGLLICGAIIVLYVLNCETLLPWILVLTVLLIPTISNLLALLIAKIWTNFNKIKDLNKVFIVRLIVLNLLCLHVLTSILVRLAADNEDVNWLLFKNDVLTSSTRSSKIYVWALYEATSALLTAGFSMAAPVSTV